MHGCGKDCENVIQPTSYPPYLSLNTDTYALWAECERHLMRRPTCRTVMSLPRPWLSAGEALLPGLAGHVLAARHRHWHLPARADGYRGGHFSVRLQDGRVLTLPGREQPIAVSATSGL